MKIPARLLPLLEEGLIDEVLSRLMSGKEADVFVVRCGGEVRCAKVYKEAAKRSFKQAVLYQEGRKSRSSRRARAMEKGSKFGRAQQEETWHNAEVDALRKLAAAGVRVPTPYACVDGVLLMELVTDGEGNVAPRLSEVILTAEQAIEDHNTLIGYVVKMLCAGIVHGDLSEFNILVDDYGPVIIDLPQAVDAAANNNAESMLLRDVNKLRDYYAEFAPALSDTEYGKEMWALYETGDLMPDTPLTGVFEEDGEAADVDGVMREIAEAIKEEQERLARIAAAESDPT
ncbi:MAG: serine protein kinase RIO [Proteobacteria bacterium]|jgi:RIO kinase 1|nr:serine protein kinase RIO [Pseudomonadota bacterium]MDA0896120.1 serine protein kinase RIO [Pseudomonadota bacterium]